MHYASDTHMEKVKNPAASCGASSKGKAKMGAAAPKPPHAIHPHSKLWGILAFSHEAPAPHMIRLSSKFNCMHLQHIGYN